MPAAPAADSESETDTTGAKPGDDTVRAAE